MDYLKIIFTGLRAEMARIGLTVADIAKVLEIDENEAEKKLSRLDLLTLEEAYTIKMKLFSSMTFQDLFAEIELGFIRKKQRASE
jgi:hypothetical protein